MSKGRDIAAESLHDVLELARSRRQSGLLSIEHAQGGRFEEGEIYFQNGQPIYARVEQMLGQEALTWLLRWHHIHFTFLTNAPRPPTNIPVQFAGDIGSNVSFPQLTVPSSPASYPQFGGKVSTSISTERAPSYPSISSRPNSFPSRVETLVPQKLEKERDVLSLPLTRPQRCIYLLVNGQRTIADLSRTTSKSIQEVERILSELQEQGLVFV